VGREAAAAISAFVGNDAAVDRYPADQLLVFLADAGSEVAVPAMADHIETGLDLLSAFGFEVGVAERKTGAGLSAEGDGAVNSR
jgi:RNA 3'-terminal phosphate cyclase (ATP)